MIPASRFHDNGDGTALWVRELEPVSIAGVPLDRPCDSCNGWGMVECVDCDGSGRHTFDIEVDEDPEHIDGHATGYRIRRILRVHAIDVLPIYGNEFGGLQVTADLGAATLPPAAEPNLWLVRLEVHA